MSGIIKDNINYKEVVSIVLKFKNYFISNYIVNLTKKIVHIFFTEKLFINRTSLCLH